MLELCSSFQPEGQLLSLPLISSTDRKVVGSERLDLPLEKPSCPEPLVWRGKDVKESRWWCMPGMPAPETEAKDPECRAILCNVLSSRPAWTT